jgi:hypothetical protein
MSRGRRAEQGSLFALDAEENEVGGLDPEAPLELPLDLAGPLLESPPGGPPAAPARARALAGAVDIGVHLLAAGVAVAGVLILDVALRRGQWPGFALLLLVFSLFYTVVPLAFWGRTGGMAVAGIACRGEDGQPLSFSEAARRWLGGLLTVLLLGLPALPVLASRPSPADRLSGRVPVLD